MIDLQPPGTENVILSAYAAISKGKTDDQADLATLVAKYESLFVTAVPPTQSRESHFERFSLVDPNLRTVIKSSTAQL